MQRVRTKCKWACPNCFFLFPWGIFNGSVEHHFGELGSIFQFLSRDSNGHITVAVVHYLLKPSINSKLPYLFPCPFFFGGNSLCGHTKITSSEICARNPKSGSGRKVKESLEEVEITIHNPSKVKKRCMAMGWKVKLGEFGWGPGGMGIFTEKGTWII